MQDSGSNPSSASFYHLTVTKIYDFLSLLQQYVLYCQGANKCWALDMYSTVDTSTIGGVRANLLLAMNIS